MYSHGEPDDLPAQHQAARDHFQQAETGERRSAVCSGLLFAAFQFGRVRLSGAVAQGQALNIA